MSTGNWAAGPSGYCECGLPAGDFFIVDVGFIVTWLGLGLVGLGLGLGLGLGSVRVLLESGLGLGFGVGVG